MFAKVIAQPAVDAKAIEKQVRADIAAKAAGRNPSRSSEGCARAEGGHASRGESRAGAR